MPYCPKCDMEFVDGVTVCSDCGGPLAATKEEAMALKEQQKEEALAKQREEMEAFLRLSEEGAEQPEKPPAPPAGVYVKKADRYEDLKSSASAFLLVGGCLVIFSGLCWTGILNLPMAGVSKLLFQGVLSAMGIGSILVAINTSKSAKGMASQIDEENRATEQLIQWFVSSYTADELDRQLAAQLGELGPEELSLKRFELIQDIIITNHDIADQAYVDSLSEEIYAKVFEEQR